MAAAEVKAGDGQCALVKFAQKVVGIRPVVVYERIKEGLRRGIGADLAPFLPVKSLHEPHVLQEPYRELVPHSLVESKGRVFALLPGLGVVAAVAAQPFDIPGHCQGWLSRRTPSLVAIEMLLHETQEL